MKTSKFLILFLSIMLIFPSLAVAYGEGTTQGAVKSGIDSGKICRCETLEQVRQGHKWHTRPEALKKTAYEFLESFHDAERNLLDSYEVGGFTDEEVKDILQWLRDNKMYMSDRAIKTLNKLSGTPESSVTKSPKTTSTGKNLQTTASAPATKATSSMTKHQIEASLKRKGMTMLLLPEKVRDMLADLRKQNPKKNEFAIQDMLYRKIFTKEERDFMESDVKTHLGARMLINELSK